MTGSSTNPSIYAEIANIKSNIGIYNTPNSNITNDFNNLKSIIGAYNNTNYPNTTTPATITQDLINLNKNGIGKNNYNIIQASLTRPRFSIEKKAQSFLSHTCCIEMSSRAVKKNCPGTLLR